MEEFVWGERGSITYKYALVHYQTPLHTTSNDETSGLAEVYSLKVQWILEDDDLPF